jgi:WD40 repeat protein
MKDHNLHHTFDQLYPYEGHGSLYKPQNYDKKSNYLLTCDWDGKLKQFSLQDFELHRTYENSHSKGARTMVATHNSQHIFIADLDGGLTYYTLEAEMSMVFRSKTKEHESAIRAMAITHDDTFLFTGSFDGILKQHYIHPTAKCILMRKKWDDISPTSAAITAIVISYDNEFVFVADKDGILRQFSIKHHSMARKFGLPGEHGTMNCLCLSLNNISMFIGYRTGFLREINAKTGKIIKDYGWFDKLGIKS